MNTPQVPVPEIPPLPPLPNDSNDTSEKPRKGGNDTLSPAVTMPPKTSIYVGVTFRPVRIKFQARIYKNNKEYNLGLFDLSTDAAVAYDAAHRLISNITKENGRENEFLKKYESDQNRKEWIDMTDEEADRFDAGLDRLNFLLPSKFKSARERELIDREMKPVHDENPTMYPNLEELKLIIRKESIRVAKVVAGLAQGSSQQKKKKADKGDEKETIKKRKTSKDGKDIDENKKSSATKGASGNEDTKPKTKPANKTTVKAYEKDEEYYASTGLGLPVLNPPKGKPKKKINPYGPPPTVPAGKIGRRKAIMKKSGKEADEPKPPSTNHKSNGTKGGKRTKGKSKKESEDRTKQDECVPEICNMPPLDDVNDMFSGDHNGVVNMPNSFQNSFHGDSMTGGFQERNMEFKNVNQQFDFEVNAQKMMMMSRRMNEFGNVQGRYNRNLGNMTDGNFGMGNDGNFSTNNNINYNSIFGMNDFSNGQSSLRFANNNGYMDQERFDQRVMIGGNSGGMGDFNSNNFAEDGNGLGNDRRTNQYGQDDSNMPMMRGSGRQGSADNGMMYGRLIDQGGGSRGIATITMEGMDNNMCMMKQGDNYYNNNNFGSGRGSSDPQLQSQMGRSMPPSSNNMMGAGANAQNSYDFVQNQMGYGANGDEARLNRERTVFDNSQDNIGFNQDFDYGDHNRGHGFGNSDGRGFNGNNSWGNQIDGSHCGHGMNNFQGM